MLKFSEQRTLFLQTPDMRRSHERLIRFFGLLLFAGVVIYMVVIPPHAHTDWQARVRVHPEPVMLQHVLRDGVDPVPRRSAPNPHMPLQLQRDIVDISTHFAKLKNGPDFFADYDIGAVDAERRIRREEASESPTTQLKFHYLNSSTSPFYFKWVSSKPMVALIPEFLTDEECDALVAQALPNMARSQVAIRKNDGDKNPINEVRTSSQTWLDTNSGPAAPIVDRIFKLTGFQPGSSEMLQILRYEVSQKYDAHQDYFDPENYGPQPTNRAVTVYLYLSDVEEGGETWFPGADNKPVLTQDYKSCKGGFGFRPHKRSIVVFYDMTPTGGYDLWSLHGACPVKKGTKWGGTLWLRVPTA
jgi:prolyl 4-hydroxylase